jgi:uncharacterized phiE125 gp8 family phage protein
MTLTLVTAPTDLPLTYQELSEHLNLEGMDAEEPVVMDCLQAAMANLEGVDGWLGRALLSQTWDYKLDRFPNDGKIEIPLPPLRSITSVTYVDSLGATQTVSSSNYKIVGLGGTMPAYIMPVPNASWPGTASPPDPVTIRFVCGYVNRQSVPLPIKHALKQMVSDMYENRQDLSLVRGSSLATLKVADEMLAPYRIWNL